MCDRWNKPLDENVGFFWVTTLLLLLIFSQFTTAYAVYQLSTRQGDIVSVVCDIVDHLSKEQR